MINVTLPEDFANTLIGLSASSFLPNPFQYFFDENKAKEAPDFAQYTFSTTLFLLNSNSFILAVSIAAISYVCLTIIKLTACTRVVYLYFGNLLEEYYWSVPLRIGIQLYLDLGVTALLQFYDFSWSQYGAIANGIPAILILPLFIISPLVLIVFSVKHSHNLIYRTDPKFAKRWGTLCMEFKPNSSSKGLVFYPLYLLRRCLYGISLVYLHPYPQYQLFSFVLLSLLV